MSSRTFVGLRVFALLAVMLTIAGMSFAQTAVDGVLEDPLAAPLAAKVTSLGFRANEGGGGKLDLGYTGGNLGNTWAEGEWVPYQLVISDIPAGLAGLDSILISFDFTRYGGGDAARFVDLVRDLQVSMSPLDDTQGWPKPDGTAFPLTTRAEIEIAQNHASENLWDGFAFLNLPTSQINLTLDSGLDVPTGEDRHMFKIYKSDLLAAGIDANAETLVVYYQLHESRTFIWENQLQAGYNQSPTDLWGGYLYGTDGWPTADAIVGSGYVPGSSGHIHLENLTGSQDVPIPIPETLPGIVTGLKWRDDNGNGVKDGAEPTLSGWEIHVFGTVENIDFTTSTHTDGVGQYSFPNLTSGTIWTIKEDAQRDTPPETGYTQTYPTVGVIYGRGTGVAVGPPPADPGGVGWDVALTIDFPDQPNMDFGNQYCTVAITCPPDRLLDCTDPTDPSNTGEPTVEGTCPPLDVTHVDNIIPGDCPEEYTIERWWYVTDSAGNADSCLQTIVVEDNEAPEITCPPDDTFECDETVEFGMATATDNCDPDPEITWDDVVTPGDCPYEYTVVRTWTATDACGNSASCDQTIYVVDDTPPTVYCPPDKEFECDEDIVFGSAWAEDNCDPHPDLDFEDETIPGTCPQEYVVERTWTATDACGNSASCVQVVTVVDDTPPVIYCAPDDTVECHERVVFTWPEAEDNCDLEPEIVVVSSDTLSGPAQGETIYRMCWVAYDDCGNESEECCQSIYMFCPLCSYTQGGWGSGCPTPQQERPESTQPGCIRDHYWDDVFPDGVMIGDTTGARFGAVFTSAAAVEAFLPSGGPAKPFNADYVNPTGKTSAGVLAGQVLALKLNREYSCAGVFEDLGLTPAALCYGIYEVPSECGIFEGMTVDEFLALADEVLAGNTSVLTPYHAKVSDVNFTATCLNEAFDDCDVAIEMYPLAIPYDGKPSGKSGSADQTLRASDAMPSEFAVTGIQPNPLTGSTTIGFALPTAAEVSIEIYGVDGRRVTTLLSQKRQPGQHSVVWNGRDSRGEPVGQGVYFCQVRFEGQPAIMKKLVKLN
jgi:hypothetical protein